MGQNNARHNDKVLNKDIPQKKTLGYICHKSKVCPMLDRCKPEGLIYGAKVTYMPEARAITPQLVNADFA